MKNRRITASVALLFSVLFFSVTCEAQQASPLPLAWVTSRYWLEETGPTSGGGTILQVNSTSPFESAGDPFLLHSQQLTNDQFDVSAGQVNYLRPIRSVSSHVKRVTGRSKHRQIRAGVADRRRLLPTKPELTRQIS